MKRVVVTGMGAITPVSYTHLDVYKRQALTRRVRSCLFYSEIYAISEILSMK